MAWTLSQMQSELWEMLGEPSDLDPSTTAGAAKLTRWINEGQRRVAGWKFPDGHLVRFPVLMAEKFFQAQAASFTADGTPTTSTIGLDSSASAVDDFYNGWLAYIGGEYVTVVDYGGMTLTVAPSLSTAPAAADAVVLYKNWYQMVGSGNPIASANVVLDPAGTFVDILKIEDVSNGAEIERAERPEAWIDTRTSAGQPSSWSLWGNRICFDVSPDAAYWFRMEYYRNPSELAAAGDISELPESWHEGIVLWARWWGFARGQETAMGYSAKKDFQEFMQLTRQSLEMGYERVDGGVSVER